MKPKFIIGIIVIAAFFVWGLSSLVKTTIPYVPISEVARTSGTMQVMGAIDFKSVTYDADKLHLIFDVTDVDNPQSSERLKIVFSGAIPGNFDQAKSVVVKGHYEAGDNAFIAEEMYVKCPSKYLGEEGEA